jgi:GNAT superfamily N-acetyltransferase
MIDIKFTIQKSTESNVYNHLSYIDNDFVPRLSNKIDLNSFSKKISNNTIRFEAWHVDKLIALVSAYFNNYEAKTGYINHVGVCKEYRGLGISDTLITNAINYGIDRGFKDLKLEVSKDNLAAVKLYRKYNFNTEKIQSNMMQMCKNLNNGETK